MKREDIQKVIDRVPGLTDFGIGIFMNGHGMTQDERREKIKEEQGDLLDNAEACTLICEWLADVEKIQGIDTSHANSYGLKHAFEDDTGVYVTNGAFIAAAIHCGFPYKIEHGDPNVSFGMSRLSLRRKRQNARERMTARDDARSKSQWDASIAKDAMQLKRE